MANSCHNATVPIYESELWKSSRLREPRTTGKPLHEELLSRNMGDHRLGCWLLDRDAPKAEVGSRSGELCVQHILHGMRRASR